MNKSKYRKKKKNQQDLTEIENYKSQGTIIRSKEKNILNEEKPILHISILKKNNSNNNKT